jgi:hypothetical protein
LFSAQLIMLTDIAGNRAGQGCTAQPDGSMRCSSADEAFKTNQLVPSSSTALTFVVKNITLAALLLLQPSVFSFGFYLGGLFHTLWIRPQRQRNFSCIDNVNFSEFREYIEFLMCTIMYQKSVLHSELYAASASCMTWFACIKV